MEGIRAATRAAGAEWATARPTCPSCRMQVTLRARVLTLAGGGEAVAAADLRRALWMHLRRCTGR